MKTNFTLLIIALAAMALVSCNNKESEVLAVRLDKTKIELVKGESLQLHAQVVPEQDAEITWYSEDDKYVKVDGDGVVTALALKKDTDGSDDVLPVSVYAKYKNGADQCMVTVLPLAPERVEIVYDEQVVRIDPAESIQLVAKVYPEDADLTDLTWSTSYASIATVDNRTGVVTGVSSGFAVIRASYSEKIYGEIDVQVKVVDPVSVAVVPSELSMTVGSKQRLKAELTPTNASGKLIWTSDDTAVAVIDDETGTVTAVAPGETFVKVQVGKVSGECRLIVK